MKSAIFRGLTMLALSGALVVAVITAANAAPLQRLVADFQNNTSVGGDGEISTTIRPNEGGLLVYSKTLSIPFKVVYVTFSGQADVHNGSALLMQASISSGATTTVCQPLAGQTGAGGGGPHVFPNWYTLLHVPAATTGTNCDDGGGGTGDCHDNTIMFSCCAQITPDNVGEDVLSPTTHTVNIKLADLPGFLASPPTGSLDNVAFYERSTIYIDATGKAGEEEDDGGGPSLCNAHGVP